MNGYNFTERVRKVLQMAREESIALRHEYVGTEHILLALCAEGGGVASAALSNLEIDGARVREEVLKVVKPASDAGRASSSEGILGAIADTIGIGRTGRDLPYTSRAKKVLELALSEVRRLGHSYVGTEHLLIALVQEERGIAAQVLTSLGLTTEKLRAEVLRLLGTEGPRDTNAVPTNAASRGRELEAAITLVVEHPDGRIEAKKFRRTGDAVVFLNGLEY
jgi:ATP-dependent Clp protease ATP-binding subunit ClpC